MDNPNDSHAAVFIDLLDSFGLEQHVQSITQVSGHTLHLIITRKMNTVIKCPPVADCFLSDHSTVLCHLDLTKSNHLLKQMSYRKLKSINRKSFKQDLRPSNLCQRPVNELDGLTNCCSTTLADLLDRHAPPHVRSVVVRRRVPWLTNEIRQAKRKRRRSERRWRTTKLDADL